MGFDLIVYAPLFYLASDLVDDLVAHLVKRRSAGVGNDDLIHTSGYRLFDEFVDGIDHLIPKADIGTQQ